MDKAIGHFELFADLAARHTLWTLYHINQVAFVGDQIIGSICSVLVLLLPDKSTRSSSEHLIIIFNRKYLIVVT